MIHHHVRHRCAPNRLLYTYDRIAIMLRYDQFLSFSYYVFMTQQVITTTHCYIRLPLLFLVYIDVKKKK